MSGSKGPKGWYTIVLDDGTSVRSRAASLCKPVGSVRGPGRVRLPGLPVTSTVSETDSDSDGGLRDPRTSASKLTAPKSRPLKRLKNMDGSVQSSARVVDFHPVTTSEELRTVLEFRGIPTVPELDFREVGLPGLWRLPDRYLQESPRACSISHPPPPPLFFPHFTREVASRNRIPVKQNLV